MLRKERLSENTLISIFLRPPRRPRIFIAQYLCANMQEDDCFSARIRRVWSINHAQCDYENLILAKCFYLHEKVDLA